MTQLLSQLADLAWPMAVAFAWVLGELGHRHFGLPRISVYGLAGFVFGHTQLGMLPATDTDTVMLLANVECGLSVFVFGYRSTRRGLRTTPWSAATGGAEALATFVAAYAMASVFGMSALAALLLASLAMSTSPAAILRVINEERSSGQVTERAMHLTAINCVLAVFVFKSIVGFWMFQASGSVWEAVSGSIVLLVASVALGMVFGVGVPSLLRHFGRLTRDATVGFAIGVILLVAIAHAFRLSPVLAALTFGFVARHRRVTLNQAQRNFGAIGDLLAVVLFVFVAATIDWHRVWAGLGLALVLIFVRLACKVFVVGAFARVSGVSWRKGVLTGLAMTPISVFVILLLEQARFMGIDLIDQLAPLAAVTLLLEIIGPIVSQRALHLAGESAEAAED